MGKVKLRAAESSSNGHSNSSSRRRRRKGKMENVVLNNAMRGRHASVRRRISLSSFSLALPNSLRRFLSQLAQAYRGLTIRVDEQKLQLDHAFSRIAHLEREIANGGGGNSTNKPRPPPPPPPPPLPPPPTTSTHILCRANPLKPRPTGLPAPPLQRPAIHVRDLRAVKLRRVEQQPIAALQTTTLAPPPPPSFAFRSKLRKAVATTPGGTPLMNGKRQLDDGEGVTPMLIRALKKRLELVRRVTSSPSEDHVAQEEEELNAFQP